MIATNLRQFAEGTSLQNKDKKACPVCDNLVDINARRCPSCDTDLTLFDIDMNGELDVDKITISDEKEIDDILSSIVGKDESSKLLEDIKSIGKESKLDLDEDEGGEVEAEPEKYEVDEVVDAEEAATFECPSCGADVDADAATCPNCGVEFEEEEALEFECPVCGSSVASDADTCSNCGVKFEEKEEAKPSAKPEVEAKVEPEAEAEEAPPPELPEEKPPPKDESLELSDRLLIERKERLESQPPETFEGKDLYKVLPTLVNEIKPLLTLAKKGGMDIGHSRELISKAVAANKARDIDTAVDSIVKARRTLEDTLTEEIANDIEELVQDVKVAKEFGCDVAGSKELIREAITALREENYEVAISDLEAAINEFERTAGNYRQANRSLEEADQLIEDASALGVDTKEASQLLAEGREAINRKSWETTVLFAKRVKEDLSKALPKVLQEEMRKAKESLLELKMKGEDLRKPMGIYKQASISLKKKDFSEALRHLKAFRKELPAEAS